MIVIDGIYYALALCGAGALVAWIISPWFAAPLWLLAAFCLYFFRDPDRAIPAGPVRNLIAFHLVLTAVLVVGSVFRDAVGQILRVVGSLMALLASLAALSGNYSEGRFGTLVHRENEAPCLRRTGTAAVKNNLMEHMSRLVTYLRRE